MTSLKRHYQTCHGKDFAGKIDHPNVEKFGDFSVRGDFNLKEDGELIEKIIEYTGLTEEEIENL